MEQETDPRAYQGTEWKELLKALDGKAVKKSLRGAARAEANKARKIAQDRLMSSGLHVRGDTSDWKKGLRSRLYPARFGLGFLLTVKPRAANKSGNGERSMHKNRYGLKKPVLMWAEDGTGARKTKTKTKWFVRKKKGHNTGRMPRYGFLERSAPEMYQTVSDDLAPEIEKKVKKAARKCGFL